MEKEINDIFEKLFAYFQVDSISSLARAINTPQSTVQKWKDRMSKNAIEKACRRLGIYREIFNIDYKPYDSKYSQNISSATNVTQTGNIRSSDVNAGENTVILKLDESLYKRLKKIADQEYRPIEMQIIKILIHAIENEKKQ